MVKRKEERDIKRDLIKESGEITEERKETKAEEKYRKRVYSLDDIVFVKEKTKSPRAQRREAKQFGEALRKRRAEIEAEEALLKKTKKK